MEKAMDMHSTVRIDRLRNFVGDLSELIDGSSDEAQLVANGARLLGELVSHDDWLPDDYARADPQRYQQYLLHCDGRQRFSVVSFVWGPGQSTPVHDHRTWGLVGVLRGAEIAQSYERGAGGMLRPTGPARNLLPGEVDLVSPATCDIHKVSNAYDDEVTISIHVYGANIGAVRRATYGDDGHPKPFVSGYANTTLPNLWDLSKEITPQ